MLELASILILGIAAQWLAWRIKMPAIFPLILIGLLAGPLASMDILLGYKLIDPSMILNKEMLSHFVSLSVGVILYEGGLTLRLRDVRSVASTVRNLLIIGPIISLIGGALAAHYFIGMDIRIALLFGALIIVTGPTVIGPILRNVRPVKKVATVLKWEGILIDPIGALVAVLMYEFILTQEAGAPQFTLTAMVTFGKTVLAGAVMGVISAYTLYYLIKRKLVPEYLRNVLSLALVVACYALADIMAKESGLLAVTLMGMILANTRLPEIREILTFKESLVILLISILFIILSANIDLSQLQLLGWGTMPVFLVVVFLLRPLSVFLSSIGSNLNIRERVFISWIGPRGIVAAAVASIFALSIVENTAVSAQERADAQLLIPLTFMIILGTVVLQGTTAKMVARWLGVIDKDPAGYLILGAHEGSRAIAKYLQNNGVHVVLVDTSHNNINEARMMNLKVMELNILSEYLTEQIELSDIGYFLALTSNNELNILACRKFRKEFGRDTSYRLITRNEMKFTSLVRPKDILFGNDVDFYKLISLARKYPTLQEIQIEGKESLEALLADFPASDAPIFTKHKNGQIKVVLAEREVDYEEGLILAYMGDHIRIEKEESEEAESL